MRWPWRKRQPDGGPVPSDVGEATAARQRAEEALARAIDQSGEIQQVAATSRRHGRVNHFAQLISDTFRGA